MPGALGLQGIFALLGEGTTGASGALAITLQTVLIAAALVVGLTISESFIRPRTLPEMVAADKDAHGAV